MKVTVHLLETLSDRIYDALRLRQDDARIELRRIADEADQHHDLSLEQREYLKLLTISHLPSIAPEEARQVARLFEQIGTNVGLKWLGEFYSAMCLYHAGLVENCLVGSPCRTRKELRGQ